MRFAAILVLDYARILVMKTYAVIFSLGVFAAAGAGCSATSSTDARDSGSTDANGSVDANIDASGSSTPDGRSDEALDTNRDAPVVTTAPWPESCVPPDNLPRPAGEALLTGPAGTSMSGEPGGPGEMMTAKLNGYLRSFNRFQTKSNALVGNGFDGSITLTLPSFAVGSYACPTAVIDYANLNAGARDSNAARSRDCCTIEITRSGAVGEIVEGTFSGIMIHGPLISWIKVEDGRFAIVRR